MNSSIMRSARRRVAILIVTVALLPTAWPAAAAPPVQAINYIEFPEAGPLAESGREMQTSGAARYGIDINSRLDIEVKNDELQNRLAAKVAAAGISGEVTALSKRLESLTRFAASLESERNQVRELFDLFAAASVDFNAKLITSAQNRSKIFDALLEARQRRLQFQGLGEEVALVVAKKDLDPIFQAGPRLSFGYDWELLGELYAEEIKAAEIELGELGSQLGFHILVRAHLVRRNGQSAAVFLPHYNQAATGPESRYEKLKFAPAAGEREMYDAYKKMAKKLERQRGAGKVLVTALEQQYEVIREPLAEVTAGAKDAVANAKDQLRSLKQWGEADKRESWLNSVEADLKDTPKGVDVLASWAELKESLGEIRDDIEALETYASLDNLLGGQDGSQAIDTILSAIDAISTKGPNLALTRVLDTDLWGERFDKIDKFVEAVKALQPGVSQKLKQPGSPHADLVATRDALRDFSTAIRDSAGKIKGWLSEVVLGNSIYQASANLPVPAGERQVAVASDAQLNTSINLLTIPAPRSVNDTLQVEYFFFQQDTDLQIGWIDLFTLQSYGWQSEVLASLAFAKHEDEETWKPTVAMNWILSHNGWPERGDRGRRASNRLKWVSGFGLSGVSLDTSDDQDVEMGLAVTAAFLNNRLLLGYGVNLQADEDEEFWFLSVRLFTFPGLSDQPGSLLGQ